MIPHPPAVRSLWYLPRFFQLSESVVRQLRVSAGFLGGKLLIDKNLVFWTATAWADQSAMRSFRDSGAHRIALPKLVSWCDEAAVGEIETGENLPSWSEIHDRLSRHGRSSRVRDPSPDHALLNFPPPQWTRLERKIRPATA